MSGIERRLTEDLASQAAIVLRNVRMTAELQKSVEQISALTVQLRESRRRVVEVQDAERRRIERTLHDEAQQYLMALVIQLDRALIVLEKSPERIAERLPKLRALQEQVAEVLSGFSSGLSPADLAERGLADTLRSHVERLSLPVVIDDGGVGRYAPQVEEAGYYTTLEAVQNAVKHSGAKEIRLSFSGDERGLHFVVADDGKGFSPDDRDGAGSGFRGMAERIEKLGGRLDISSVPGAGTRVEGFVPVRELAVAGR